MRAFSVGDRAFHCAVTAWRSPDVRARCAPPSRKNSAGEAK
jgi:hypothetical protein